MDECPPRPSQLGHQLVTTLTHDEALALSERYQKLRDECNAIAYELENSYYVGEYYQPEQQEWKPLLPGTRPTQFRFMRST
jgi:hypothetical protein